MAITQVKFSVGNCEVMHVDKNNLSLVYNII